MVPGSIPGGRISSEDREEGEEEEEEKKKKQCFFFRAKKNENEIFIFFRCTRLKKTKGTYISAGAVKERCLGNGTNKRK